MIKYALLFVALLFSAQICTAQDVDKIPKERGEVYFSFELKPETNPGEQLAIIDGIISIDKVTTTKVLAYANTKGFEQFQKLGYSIDVLTAPSMLLSQEEIDGSGSRVNWDYYPNYSEYIDIMNQFVTDYPSLCELVNIGSTVEGRDLLFIHINNNLGTEADEPEFMYTSSMHGDELTGYILMLRLIEHLLENYGTDERIATLVNEIDIWINPLANPDGTFATGDQSVFGATRFNANAVDLNRNYPDPEDGPHPDGKAYQPETVAFMDFADAHHFTLSANLHTGAEVVNYPWDTWAKLAADDDWWYYISRQYADTAHTFAPAGYLTDLNDGITNGYAWYSISGGRQDYMNYEKQCREFTLELSSTKLPPPSQLPDFWEYNYRSLLSYLGQSLFGVRGLITDANTGEAVHAEVFIESHDKDQSQVFSSLPIGNYHRLLHSGTYSITYRAEGYEPFIVNNVVVANDSTTIINVQLDSLVGIEDITPQTQVFIYPNPVEDIINIRLAEMSKEIVLINSSGIAVSKIVPTSKNSQLDVSRLSKGMYLLVIRFEEHTDYRKIIVQ